MNILTTQEALERSTCGLIVGLAMLLASGSAMAQVPYPELAAKGAKGLTAEEVKKTLTGARMKGRADGIDYEFLFAEGDELKGSLESPRGSAALLGKWNVNAQHQYCVDYTVPDINLSRKGCRRLFRVGEEFYVAVSGQGQSAMMGKVEITK